MADDEFAIHSIPGAEKAIRSRNVIERKVIQPLRDANEFSDDLLEAIQNEFNVAVYAGSGTSESSRQPLLLGLPEVEYLRRKAEGICQDNSDDVKAATAAAKLLFQPARRNEER